MIRDCANARAVEQCAVKSVGGEGKGRNRRMSGSLASRPASVPTNTFTSNSVHYVSTRHCTAPREVDLVV